MMSSESTTTITPAEGNQPISAAATTAQKVSYGNRLVLAACSLLLVAFMVLSYLAALTKSATYDEPMHAMGAWAHLHLHDFRINFEDPPLWHYWAAIPNGRNSIQVNLQDPDWVSMPNEVYREFPFSTRTLYQSRPTNDGAAFVNRSRFMMLLFGVGLGALIVAWAWQLAGPIPALMAAVLFCFDPNFLAHSSLVKNDVAMAMMMTAVLLICWRVGKNLTILNAASLALVIAAAVNVKFSALLLGPIVLALLLLRALLPGAWVVLGKSLNKLWAKVLVTSALLAVIGIVSYVGIWASYGFRFNPSPDPNIVLNTQLHRTEAKLARNQISHNEYDAEHPAQQLPPFDPTMPPAELLKGYSDAVDSFVQAVSELKAAMSDSKLSPEGRAEFTSFIEQAENVIQQADIGRDSARRFLTNIPPRELQAPSFAEQYTKKCEDIYKTWGDLVDWIGKTQYALYVAHTGEVSDKDRFIDAIVWLLDHHLFPSAWLHGVLFVHARSFIRGAYLLGNISNTGWWYYFPIAMLCKMPVATFLGLLGATVLGAWVVAERWKQWPRWIWSLACLLVPFAIYMASVMSSNLNIGIRHVLPVYPLMYITTAVLIGLAWKQWRKPAAIASIALGVLLMFETVLACPNYIAYFNFVLGGPRGGFNYLGDSNLDWGQDLPLLAKWQKNHPDLQLALAYFGSVSPDFYDIQAAPLPPGLPPPQYRQAAYLAVSATRVQGVYGGDYVVYQQFTPMEVLGGTIYIYDLRNLANVSPGR